MRLRCLPAVVTLTILTLAASLATAAAPSPQPVHVIEVIDEQTGRGVPLVEIETVDRVRYYTDSNGVVAFNEPGLMNQKVFFGVSSFGYEFPEDMFGFHGTIVETTAGGTTKLKIKRLNIAERLYRITGQGIYRDTILAGRKPPVDVPLLNAQVVGQDSVQATVYRGKAYFFWGDTSKLGYPLGNFRTTGATVALPGKGGPDPAIGVVPKYFTDPESAFTKQMIPLTEQGPVWIDGVLTASDDGGKERMLAHFSRMQDLGTRLERGLITFDDASETFKKLLPVPLETRLAPGGHAFRAMVDGQAYFYFAVPYPCVRVRADWRSITDLSSYEAFTCLQQDAPLDLSAPKLDRDAAGELRFAWKKNTPPLEPRELEDQEAGHPARRTAVSPQRCGDRQAGAAPRRLRFLERLPQEVRHDRARIARRFHARRDLVRGVAQAGRAVGAGAKDRYASPRDRAWPGEARGHSGPVQSDPSPILRSAGRADHLLRRDLHQQFLRQPRADAALRVQPDHVPPGLVRPAAEAAAGRCAALEMITCERTPSPSRMSVRRLGRAA